MMASFGLFPTALEVPKELFEDLNFAHGFFTEAAID